MENIALTDYLNISDYESMYRRDKKLRRLNQRSSQSEGRHGRFQTGSTEGRDLEEGKGYRI